MKSKKQIVSYYSDAVSALDAKIADFHKRINRLSFFRLGTFLAAIACIYLFGTSGMLLYGIYSALLLICIFFYMIKRYSALQEALAYNQNLRKVLRNELNCLSDGANRYDEGGRYSNASHPYTDDLDIFGSASLFHFINRCTTANGGGKLASWLQDINEETAILQRQEAVIELKEHIEKTYWFRACLLPQHQDELNNIVHALKHHFKKLLAFTDSKILRLYAFAAPWLMTVLLSAVFLTALSWEVLIPLLFLNYLINARYAKNISTMHELTGRSSAQIQVYAQILRWIETTPWKGIHLQRLAAVCRKDNGEPAFRQAEQLAALIKLLDYRLNIIVSTVLNLGFLWDIRCAFKIRKWHEASAETIINSLEVIGGFEALISISTLSYNHPCWIFPQLKEGFVFDAEEMGHPLIREDKRVTNNFRSASEKTVDVITGSNMAGKSTFLRTVGVNMVLAFTGAPVCCKKLVLSPFKLVSYMRIKDSLSESTSTFKAEINRLKMILDTAETAENPFVLVDEMLRGTNSRDKFLGTKAFIEKLLQMGTPAIIATHDLQAAHLAEQHPGRIRNYHFDIQTDGQDMFFDYKIKTGECRTFNASILLKQIGLSIDEPDQNESAPAG